MELWDAIAIDGPVASGKTTVGKKVAERLGYTFLDTGVMYRAVAYASVNAQVDPSNEEDVSMIAEKMNIAISPPSKMDGRLYDVVLDGEDITWGLREKYVRVNVSLVSTYQRVRKALTEKQREIGLVGKVVMVGRDIGTVVLPDAVNKFFLIASVEERARRRFLEEKESGKEADYDDILLSLQERDRIDSSRKLAPLRSAEDAHIIDTDNKNIDQVVEEIINLIREA